MQLRLIAGRKSRPNAVPLYVLCSNVLRFALGSGVAKWQGLRSGNSHAFLSFKLCIKQQHGLGGGVIGDENIEVAAP